MPKGKGKQKNDVETTPAEENSIEILRKELSQVKKIQEVTNSVFAEMRKEISSVGGKVNDLMECISEEVNSCLLYTSPSPRDGLLSRMPSSA